MGDSFELRVIIPSAVDMSGISRDFFEVGHMNLLPMVHKSLIRYLIDDLEKPGVSGAIGQVCVVIDEDDEDNYTRALAPAQARKVIFEHQYPYDEKGIFSLVDKFAEMKKWKRLDTPILVLFGDSLLQDRFLAAIVREAEKSWEEGPTEAWIVMGMVTDDDRAIDRIPFYLKPEYDFAMNRSGYFMTRAGTLKEMGKEGDPINLWKITREDIVDVVTTPSYPELHFEPDLIALIGTGAMVFSPKALKQLHNSKRRDPQGLYSVMNVIRRALIENQEIGIVGVVSESAKSWFDINYPWEYLQANNTLCNRLASGHDTEGLHIDLEGTHYRVFDDEELKKAYPYETDNGKRAISDIRFGYTDEFDDVPAWGVHPTAEIQGSVIAPDPAAVEDHEYIRIHIGERAQIQGCCVLRNGCIVRNQARVACSVICEEALVDSFSLVDHTVLMKKAKVLTHSCLPYAIVGENVIVGGNTFAACERIDRRGNGADEADDGQLQKVAGLYYSANRCIRYVHRFSTVIGNNSEIGMNVNIQPGRRIAKNCRIFPGLLVRKNYPVGTVVRLTREGERIEETNR